MSNSKSVDAHDQKTQQQESLDCITHVPNTSRPTLVKGGPISVWGRSAIFCSSRRPSSFLQKMQELINLAMAPWLPISQYPAFLRALDCSRRRNQAIIDAGISFDELLDFSLLAMLYRFTSVRKLPQLDLARSEGLFSSNHKKRRMRCSGETWNEWNICSTSHTAPPSLRQRRTSTPSRVFIRTGPASSSRLRDLP